MDATLRAAREAIVRRHTELENAHDFDGALGTFHAPRYEVVATGEVFEGAAAVSAFYRETHTAFPDFRLELVALHHADRAVVAEVAFRGTQTGAWRGLPATGRAVDYRFAGVFEFEEDHLVCERLYFDVLTVMRQVGIARDPTSLEGKLAIFLNHPLAVGRALLRGLRR
jgi:steroid delta-isomerase-like uncharacterized protein